MSLQLDFPAVLERWPSFLAGAALVFPIFMLMTMMSNGGFGSGVASSVARAVGAGRRDDADAALLHAIVLAIIAGGLFTLGVHFGGPALFPLVFAMVFGIFVGTYSSIYVALPIILIWGINRNDEDAEIVDMGGFKGKKQKPLP